jgi:hypothetical protein
MPAQTDWLLIDFFFILPSPATTKARLARERPHVRVDNVLRPHC